MMNPPTPHIMSVTTDRAVIPDSQYASFIERFIAFLIDFICISIPLTVLLFVIANRLEINTSNLYIKILASLLFPYYNIVALAVWRRTLGKYIMKLRVEPETEGQLKITQIILRETIGKFISSIILWMGYTAMIIHPQKQTWHDRIARTVVMKYSSH